MSKSETNQSVLVGSVEKSTLHKFATKKTLVIALLMILLIGAGVTYKILNKPFVYDPKAGQEQLKRTGTFYSEGKTCQDVANYIGQQLPTVKEPAARYNLLVQKASCQININHQESINTFLEAYKLGGVSSPTVGLVLAGEYQQNGDKKKAIQLYKEVKAHYQSQPNLDDNAKVQLQQIDKKLQELGASS